MNYKSFTYESGIMQVAPLVFGGRQLTAGSHNILTS